MLNVNKKLSLQVGNILRVIVVLLGIVDLLFQSLGRKMGFGIPNSGISFGLFANELGNLFNMLGFFLLFFFATSYIKDKSKRVSIYIIIIGGIVNISQRLVFGSVWDYISLPFMPFTNNIADILITGGIVMYIIGL